MAPPEASCNPAGAVRASLRCAARRSHLCVMAVRRRLTASGPRSSFAADFA